MGEINKSKAFTNILKKSATENEKKIQTIGSVVKTEEILPEVEPVPEKENLTVTKEISSEEPPQIVEAEKPIENKSQTQQSDQGRKLSDYLVERKIESTEPVRVSKEMHAKLKKLSAATGCSIYVILTNILEEFCDNHDKEIQSVIKKYLLS